MVLVHQQQESTGVTGFQVVDYHILNSKRKCHKCIQIDFFAEVLIVMCTIKKN